MNPPGPVLLRCSARAVLAALLGSAWVQGHAQASGAVAAEPRAAAPQREAAAHARARPALADPRLLEAGRASIGLGDVAAALGFFRRAEAISAGRRRGEGRARFGRGPPGSSRSRPCGCSPRPRPPASRCRFTPPSAGWPTISWATTRERSSNSQISLAMGADPEVVRRLALSQAIAGDQRASETTLLPLLAGRDLAAYRSREPSRWRSSARTTRRSRSPRPCCPSACRAASRRICAICRG